MDWMCNMSERDECFAQAEKELWNDVKINPKDLLYEREQPSQSPALLSPFFLCSD